MTTPKKKMMNKLPEKLESIFTNILCCKKKHHPSAKSSLSFFHSLPQPGHMILTGIV